MARQSRARALTLPDWRLITALLAASLLIALYAGGAAADTKPEGLKPYTAEYETQAKGFTLKLTRELRVGDNGEYILTNGGKKLVAGFTEEARFTTEGAQIIPSSYVYQGTGLMNRRREVHFTPGSDVIRSLYKDEWYELPYEAGTLDRMSQQEQTRLSLLNDPTPAEDTSMIVADRKDVKVYHMQYVTEESIETPLGTVKTLKFRRVRDNAERISEFWLAPEWDFLMVKTRHVEDGSEAIAVLTRATIDGEEVRAGER